MTGRLPERRWRPDRRVPPVRRGPQAWERLVRDHAGLVWTVLRRCGVEEDAAAELFHRVWLQAWEELEAPRAADALEVWLVTLAVRQVEQFRSRTDGADTPGPRP